MAQAFSTTIENKGKEVLISQALLLDAEGVPFIAAREDRIIVNYPHM
jgi:hypothetical protein